MRFPAPLLPATLVRRYKRFLSDHELADGRVITAHCPNPGSMLGLDTPGSATWLSPAPNPERKLAYTWELIRVDRGIVGINTNHPNGVVAEGIAAGRVPELAGYATLKREVKYGVNSRIDILLTDPARPPCYVEVKNVHLMRKPGLAEFPDCVTERGAKHLVELARVVADGGRAVMMYLVQRTDCRGFAIAGDIDEVYAEGLVRARAAGVETLCYRCRLNDRAIVIDRPIPFDPHR